MAQNDPTLTLRLSCVDCNCCFIGLILENWNFSRFALIFTTCKKKKTSLHSSRMRTARALTVSLRGGVYLVRGVYLVQGGVLSPGEGCT